VDKLTDILKGIGLKGNALDEYRGAYVDWSTPSGFIDNLLQSIKPASGRYDIRTGKVKMDEVAELLARHEYAHKLDLENQPSYKLRNDFLNFAKQSPELVNNPSMLGSPTEMIAYAWEDPNKPVGEKIEVGKKDERLFSEKYKDLLNKAKYNYGRFFDPKNYTEEEINTFSDEFNDSLRVKSNRLMDDLINKANQYHNRAKLPGVPNNLGRGGMKFINVIENMLGSILPAFEYEIPKLLGIKPKNMGKDRVKPTLEMKVPNEKYGGSK
jgi:hypothetical protein